MSNRYIPLGKRIVWEGYKTPVNDANLNNIESRIQNISDYLEYIQQSGMVIGKGVIIGDDSKPINDMTYLVLREGDIDVAHFSFDDITFFHNTPTNAAATYKPLLHIHKNDSSNSDNSFMTFDGDHIVTKRIGIGDDFENSIFLNQKDFKKIKELPLEKDINKYSIRQISSIAGAKAFKIIAIADKGDGIGKYRLSSIEGLSIGMRYVSVLSTANYTGGKITAIDTTNNTITVDGYVHYSLNTNTDNPNNGDIYNYLMIVNHPELGDTEVGYHTAAFGDNTQVYAVGGFGAGRNTKVLGKFGAGFGASNEIGHATLGGGTNNKFRGSSNLGGGTNNIVDSHGNLIGGTLHNLPLIFDSRGDDNGRNIVGGKQNYVSGHHNIVGGAEHEVGGSENSVSGYHQVVHSKAWRINAGGCQNTIGEHGGLSDVHGSNNISNGSAVFQRGVENNSEDYSNVAQIGVGHVATGNYQTMVGKYAKPNKDSLFTVGNGSSKSNPKNTFEVLKDGQFVINGSKPISFANSLNGSMSGTTVALDDVFPIPHTIKTNLRSKNLIPYPYADTTTTTNGITFIDNGDGSITINGTATAIASFRIIDGWSDVSKRIKLKDNSFLSGVPTGASGYYIEAYATDDNGGVFYPADTGNGEMLKAEQTLIYAYLVVTSGTTLNNVTIYPQLEYGTVATPYTPYVADDTAVTVKSCGKNLIPYPYTNTTGTKNGVTFTDNGDGSWTLNGTSPDDKLTTYIIANGNIFSGYVACKVGESATSEGLCISLTADKNADVKLAYEVAVGGQLYILIGKGVTCDNITVYPQLEVGTVATPYEPYIEGETIETTMGSDNINVLSPIAPNMTITTDNNGVVVDVEYNRDSNIVIEKLTQAIISLGGNI